MPVLSRTLASLEELARVLVARQYGEGLSPGTNAMPRRMMLPGPCSAERSSGEGLALELA
ncbi:hypothetical protein F0U60_47550 [Archangium minus]|uniref:Uncharacterized protein n=1 Tax=Archangium minus TaxID=83450 RepID=A0ABY9X6C0_9BACT|nr:hypothetical protein F0U60_47550 [Archangium minus]